MVLIRGLSVVTQFFIKPKLDVTPITTSIKKNDQVVRKEIYLAVTNKGKTTAEHCRALLLLPRLSGLSPDFKPPLMFHIALQSSRQFYLDWFEPSTTAYGFESAVPLPRESASKELDIFPDPYRVFLAGTIGMDADSIAGVQITDTIRGQHAQIATELTALRGSAVDVTVKFSWERGQVESVCKKYRLDMRSFEMFSMTQIDC